MIVTRLSDVACHGWSKMFLLLHRKWSDHQNQSDIKILMIQSDSSSDHQIDCGWSPARPAGASWDPLKSILATRRLPRPRLERAKEHRRGVGSPQLSWMEKWDPTVLNHGIVMVKLCNMYNYMAYGSYNDYISKFAGHCLRSNNDPLRRVMNVIQRWTTMLGKEEWGGPRQPWLLYTSKYAWQEKEERSQILWNKTASCWN